MRVGSRDKKARKQNGKKSTELGTGREAKTRTATHKHRKHRYERRSTYGRQLERHGRQGEQQLECPMCFAQDRLR